MKYPVCVSPGSETYNYWIYLWAAHLHGITDVVDVQFWNNPESGPVWWKYRSRQKEASGGANGRGSSDEEKKKRDRVRGGGEKR